MEYNESSIFRIYKTIYRPMKDETSSCNYSSPPELRKKFDEIARIYTLSENLIRQREVNTQAAWDQLYRRIKRSKTMQSIWNFTRTAAAILLPLF